MENDGLELIKSRSNGVQQLQALTESYLRDNATLKITILSSQGRVILDTVLETSLEKPCPLLELSVGSW